MIDFVRKYFLIFHFIAPFLLAGCLDEVSSNNSDEEEETVVAPTVVSVSPDGTNCSSPRTIATADAIAITFSETMDTASHALGGMLGSGGSRDGQDNGGAWGTASVTNDRLTV